MSGMAARPASGTYVSSVLCVVNGSGRAGGCQKDWTRNIIKPTAPHTTHRAS